MCTCRPSQAAPLRKTGSTPDLVYVHPLDDSRSASTSRSLSEPQGTLLRLHPAGGYEQRSQTAHDSFQSTHTAPPSNTASYPARTTKLPEWVSSGILQKTITPSRAARIVRVRPATLGLVGVGALTSGSVFLRSVKRKSSRMDRDDEEVERQDVCSVVCVHIPFCVPDRAVLLERLERLASSARIDNADGMAQACREAVAILQTEEGLLEDSRRFAPSIETFLADNIECAEKRFSGHVEIEARSAERIRDLEKDSTDEGQGDYGVITMVVATTEGVDLACYDEEKTMICRLRSALECISRLRGGQIAGLELVWYPSSSKDSPLTRSRLAEIFPCLKAA